jgi:hypothetical protein
VRRGEIEARSRYALPSNSRPFAITCGQTYPPDDSITTTPNNTRHARHPTSEVRSRSTEPTRTDVTDRRFPYSNRRASATGLLEHRLEVRLRGLQSIMVRLVNLFHRTRTAHIILIVWATSSMDVIAFLKRVYRR